MARIGIDTGGTFTDLIRIEAGRVTVAKVPSTPDDPGRAVLSGLAALEGAAPDDRLIHGTTVATNALLTRSQPPVALVTTRGFRDVIEIGRQTRPDLYDLEPAGTSPLVPKRLRFEVRERILMDGSVRTPIDERDVERAGARISAAGVRSVAVGFLHAYANAAHERRAAAILRRAGLLVTASHEVLPEHREYERFSTTVVDAYVKPVVAAYLAALAREAGPDRLAVMQSNGGIVSWRAAAKTPVRTVLSGPAGGAVAAIRAARAIGVERIVSFDMGGTSTDVALSTGGLSFTTEFAIGGHPVALPVLDILTVGAGGGSIARIDAGGALTVGPDSAGAEPGPIAYGRGGTNVTVTDAHVYLGRLPPDRFLGGRMRLHPELVAGPMQRLARAAGLDPVRAALGVLRVADANMERAIRRISLERGHDPADFALVAFGGAGALHAAGLAEALSMPRVIVPPAPGALSARGMAAADVVQDASLAFLLPLTPPNVPALARTIARLSGRLAKSMAAEGMPEPVFAPVLELRYRGQSFEIPVPVAATPDPDAAREAFEDAHERLYRARHPGREVEVVTVRVRATGAVPVVTERSARAGGNDPGRALDETRPAVFEAGEMATGFYSRDRLRRGDVLVGPAVVTEETATTVVPPGFRAEVDLRMNLVIERSDR